MLKNFKVDLRFPGILEKINIRIKFSNERDDDVITTFLLSGPPS